MPYFDERTLLASLRGFAGAAVILQHLNTQLVLGQPIDLSQHAQAVSAMLGVASRLVDAELTRGLHQARPDAPQTADSASGQH
jgi:protein subunit release factor B